MTSRERIYNILNFKPADRIGMHDTFHKETIARWKKEGLPDNATPQEYFDLDFDIFDLDRVSLDTVCRKESGRFRVLIFTEPFQRLCDIYGVERTLRNLARHPEDFKEALARKTDDIINRLELVFKKDMTFDGAWAWGDLAYNKGLYFSISTYKNLIYPLHKDIFQFLSSYGLFLLFHSDGMVYELIPYLLDAGVRAFHPLEENSGMDIHKLLEDYKRDLVFMGHVDIERLIREEGLRGLKKRMEYFKDNCSYIYQADYPIMPDLSFKEYTIVIEAIREFGRMQSEAAHI